jgi:ribosome biogenesis GTPase / thiamine phosphate phosphatase
MTRLKVTDEGKTMLAELGFSAFFRQQLDIDELRNHTVGRVLGVQRSGLTLGTAAGERHVGLDGRWWALPAEERPTVGDWVMIEGERVLRTLERKSLLQRMAAGPRVDVQLVAANVDTVFVVTSCNADFNPSRLERYLAWVLDARIDAVVVLTKADLAADPDDYRNAARALRRDLCIELVNACDEATLGGVRAWCQPGHTLALLGSSGVGKSTLVNTLSGESRQTTQAIREDDARGRHTTTDRSLHRLPSGAWLLDSPGMRELALAGADAGMSALFADLDELASQCRFSDCAHRGEPGCAITAALAAGTLDERRLENYRKLQREEARARESLAERHRRVRAFSKRVRQANKLNDRRS